MCGWPTHLFLSPQSREHWIDNFYLARAGMLQAAPYILQLIVGSLVYMKVVTNLHGQGTGR